MGVKVGGRPLRQPACLLLGGPFGRLPLALQTSRGNVPAGQRLCVTALSSLHRPALLPSEPAARCLGSSAVHALTWRYGTKGRSVPVEAVHHPARRLSQPQHPKFSTIKPPWDVRHPTARTAQVVRELASSSLLAAGSVGRGPRHPGRPTSYTRADIERK